MSLFVFFISLLIVAQHVSGNHVPIIRSWRLRDVTASCWYVPWLQGGWQVVGPWTHYLPTGLDNLPAATAHSRQLLMMISWLPETCWATSRREIKNTKVASSWFFLSTLNYDARSTTHQTYHILYFCLKIVLYSATIQYAFQYSTKTQCDAYISSVGAKYFEICNHRILMWLQYIVHSTVHGIVSWRAAINEQMWYWSLCCFVARWLEYFPPGLGRTIIPAGFC